MTLRIAKGTIRTNGEWVELIRGTAHVFQRPRQHEASRCLTFDTCGHRSRIHSSILRPGTRYDHSCLDLLQLAVGHASDVVWQK